MNVSIEIGIGEAMDRLSILKIKLSQIEDRDKRKNISSEWECLLNILMPYFDIKNSYKLYDELGKVNRTLWDVENELRSREKHKKFDSTFIELARSVYKLNDERSEIKKKINLLFGSKFVEEKSYSKY